MTKLESYNIVKTYVESCGYILLTTFDNYMGMGHGNKIEIRCPQGHYQMVTFEAFKENQIRDNIKTQYCKDNNIKLIRIPYYEFKNVDTILNNILNLQ